MKMVSIYATVPDGNGYSNPRMVKRIDKHIFSIAAAFFVGNDGIPTKNEEMEYEIRCPEEAEGIIKSVLRKHYGLEISRVTTD